MSTDTVGEKENCPAVPAGYVAELTVTLREKSAGILRRGPENFNSFLLSKFHAAYARAFQALDRVETEDEFYALDQWVYTVFRAQDSIADGGSKGEAVIKVQEFISAENLFEFPEEKKKESLKRPAAQPADEQAPPAKKTRKINGPEDLSVETRRAILITLPKLFKEREKISNKLFELGNHHVIPDDLMTRIDKFNADLAEVEKCPDWNAILDVQASERGSWVYGGLGFEFT